MATLASPGRSDSKSKLWELKQRLERCWELSVDWSLYPDHVTKVTTNVISVLCGVQLEATCITPVPIRRLVYIIISNLLLQQPLTHSPVFV